MKIKLITGYEYDLADSTSVKNLRSNISTMKSRGQKDRLLDLYKKLLPFKGYNGNTIAKINAAKIFSLLALVCGNDTLLTKPIETSQLPLPEESTVPLIAETKQRVARLYGHPEKAPITVSYRKDQGTHMHAAFFDHYTLRRATEHSTNIASTQNIDTFQQFAKTVVHELSVTASDYGKRPMPLTIADDADDSGLLFIPGRPREGHDLVRSAYEQRLIKKAYYRGQPILAVCAGSWQLWQAFNGTTKPVSDHNYGGGMPRIGTAGDVVNNKQVHRIELTVNTIVAGAMTAKPAGVILAANPTVNSVHWEAPDDKAIPKEFEVSAVAVADNNLAPNARNGEGQMQPTNGSIEAFEMRYGAPTVGIQWHPEAYFNHKPTLEDKRHTNILRTMAEAGDAYQAKRRTLREFKEKVSAGLLLKQSGTFKVAGVGINTGIIPTDDEKINDQDSIHYQPNRQHK